MPPSGKRGHGGPKGARDSTKKCGSDSASFYTKSAGPFGPIARVFCKATFIFQKTSFFPVFARAPGGRLHLKKDGNGIRAPFGQIGVMEDPIRYSVGIPRVESLVFDRTSRAGFCGRTQRGGPPITH